jgi:hypothetical protein
VLFFAGAGLFLTGVNLVCGLFGLFPDYMYTMRTDGNAGVDFFWSIFPTPYFYLVLPVLIYGGLISLELFLIQSVEKFMKKKKQAKTERDAEDCRRISRIASKRKPHLFLFPK